MSYGLPRTASLNVRTIKMKNSSSDSDKELKKFKSMSLSEINNEIERCLWGAHNGGTAAGRKSFFKLLISLEKIREEIYNIEAPRRDYKED